MSICSSFTISREKAREMVKKMLMSQHEKIIDLAIQQMDDFDLSLQISCETRDYTIDNTPKPIRGKR